MAESTHKAEVFRIQKLELHPNADALDIVTKDGFVIITKKGNFKVGDLAIHIQPESIVDVFRPEFSFLIDPIIKPKKLRGIISIGFLLPSLANAQEGGDLARELGVGHYEPPLKTLCNTDNIKGPSGFYPKYDIESILKSCRMDHY